MSSQHVWEEWNGIAGKAPEQTQVGAQTQQAGEEDQWLLTCPIQDQIHLLAYLSDPACLSHTCKLLSSLLYS